MKPALAPKVQKYPLVLGLTVLKCFRIERTFSIIFQRSEHFFGCIKNRLINGSVRITQSGIFLQLVRQKIFTRNS